MAEDYSREEAVALETGAYLFPIWSKLGIKRPQVHERTVCEINIVEVDKFEEADRLLMGDCSLGDQIVEHGSIQLRINNQWTVLVEAADTKEYSLFLNYMIC